MKRIIIIGASGHGKVVADIAALNGYESIIFLDNDPAASSCDGYPVAGMDTQAGEFEGDVFVAVGNADNRKKLTERYSGRHFPVLVHPSAVVAKSATVGDGTVIMAGAVINPGAKIGKGCIVNTCSSVDHDCVLGDFCHVSVGAHLSGTVTVGSGSWLGAGSTIINNVSVCEKCIIGAGAVVIKNIDEPGTYAGVPARRIK